MDFRVPELGEGIYEAEFVEWLVRPGETVGFGQSLAEVMTDKATMELPSPFSGTIESLGVEPGQTIEIGQVILRYAATVGGDARSRSAPTLAAPPAPAKPAGEADGTVGIEHSRQTPMIVDAPVAAHGDGNGAHRRTEASPAVRHMARSLGIDLAEVSGSGPKGRVLLDDLSSFIKTWRDAPGPPPKRATAADLGTPGDRIKMQGVRRSIAAHMVASKRTIPHYSYIDECDVSAMVALRSELKRPFYRQRVKLTNLPFYVKAVVAALKQVPIVNASLDESLGEIVLHDQYHIGIATATPRGLVVPVIRDADRLDLAGVAREIERLIRAAQRGTIGREELRGGTFTVSSVGNYGGLVSTPIIHHPEVGIVAIGKVFKRPVYNEADEIVPARIAYLSFSFDHRVVDGSIGAIFGNAVIQSLQSPRSLLDAEPLPAPLNQVVATNAPREKR